MVATLLVDLYLLPKHDIGQHFDRCDENPIKYLKKIQSFADLSSIAQKVHLFFLKVKLIDRNWTHHLNCWSIWKTEYMKSWYLQDSLKNHISQTYICISSKIGNTLENLNNSCTLLLHKYSPKTCSFSLFKLFNKIKWTAFSNRPFTFYIHFICLIKW